MRRLLAVTLLLGGCAVADEPSASANTAVRGQERQSAGARGVPASAIPWQRPDLWPLAVSSPRIIVHYRTDGERAMAEEVLDDLESAWRVQIDEHGASPPLDDHGVAGGDSRFDVYLWAGIDTLYVDAVAPEPSTWWDDDSTYMVLDPWGKYGGAELEANVFHELRHASQAVDDWWEHIHAFEAEATAWETRSFGFERLAVVWDDYQARPEWTLFRDDGYRTWYMYGGALFLLFVSDHVFAGDLGFLNEMWHTCLNPPGAETDPTKNEPDFADALDAILAARGSSLFGEVVAFARARWYTGARADGSLPGGAVLPDVASRTHARSGAKKTTFKVAPAMLGTSYVTVARGAGDPAGLKVSLAGTASVRHVVQVVGGGDRVLSLPAAVSFTADGRFTLAVTVLPASPAGYDPDTVGDTTYSATLTFER